MPVAMIPTTGLSDSDAAKVDKETSDWRYQVIKNRFFNLNMTSQPFHDVL